MGERRDARVALLIRRALDLGRDDIDRQLAAGELIRTAGADFELLRAAHEAAADRFDDLAGEWLGMVLAPLWAAVSSLEEERAARAADLGAPDRRRR